MSGAHSRRVRVCLRGENPSSGADCIRATFSHKGRREASYPRFGQAAATASASQLAISSVPPVGAAIGNSPCPA